MPSRRSADAGAGLGADPTSSMPIGAIFRRIAVRYERRANIHLAFTTLAAAIICSSQAERFC